MAWFQNWLDRIATATSEGRRFARVRVVSLPLTDYSRFGLWCSGHTNAAGEDIRYLDRGQAQAVGLPHYDYWLFDSCRLAVMHFDDEDDRFLGLDLITDPVTVVQHAYWRDAAWHYAASRDEFATS